MQIFNTLFLLIFIISLGFIGRLVKIFNSEAKKVLSSYIYYFALPILFFTKISQINILTIDPKIFFVILCPIIIILLVLAVLKLFNLISKNLFVISGVTISFGSYAFFGVAFFESMFGESGLNFIIINASLLGIIGIIFSIIFFEYAVNKELKILNMLKVFFNPLILSIFLGIIFSFLKIRSDFIFNPLEMISRTAGVVAIFTLGLFIYDNFSLKKIKISLLYSLFRVIVLPVVTYFFILLFIKLNINFFYDEIIYLFIQSGIPAAISIAVFAQKYDYMAEEFSQIVILTSILSFVSLSGLYFLSKILF